MKIIVVILSLFLIFGCNNKSDKIVEKEIVQNFYIGTYTENESKGIYKYALNSNGSLAKVGLVAESENPSFITKSKDDKYLIAVNEIDVNGVGAVESFLIEKDSLKIINKSSSGGAHPCFVTVNDQGYVLTANYTGGNVGLLKISDDGKLSTLLDVQQHFGKGTTDRQKSPHAHSAWFNPFNDDIISVDLGTNELWFSKIDSAENKLVFTPQQKLKMNDGAGPRHLDFHPNKKWIYVLNELDCTVTLVQKSESGEYFKGDSYSTLPEEFTDYNKCADIHITKDGNFLYASNRGHNSIAIFEIDNLNGDLKLISLEPTQGNFPRNFVLSPDEKYLLVANQKTDNIVSFKRNKESGLLEFVAEIDAPTPVCILF